MLRVPAVVLLCVSFTTHAWAQPVNCANAEDQSSMNYCAQQSYQEADAALNKTYKALSQTVSKEGLVKLKIAQRAWLSYRDAQCAFDTYGTVDGSVHSMIVSSCLEELTQAQTARLSLQLDCVEGDLSCGNQ